jgi:hypothetical protein
VRTNPLLTESLHGLAGSGRAHQDYLLYLFLQAVVLFVWWPKDSLPEALATAQTPSTLLAAVLAAGAAISWFAARAGAEELLLPGQNGLRDWAAATGLPLGRVLQGYLAGHLVQTAALVMLSLPLVLCAFTVSGGEWIPLGESLLAIVFMATYFRLAAASLYLTIGQHPATALICTRGLVLVTYLVTAMVLAPASHLLLASRLLRDEAPQHAATPVSAPAFMAVHLLACAALLVVLHRQLASVRRIAGAVTAAPSR